MSQGSGDIGTSLAAAVVVKPPKPWCNPSSMLITRMRSTVPPSVTLTGLAHEAHSQARADAQQGGFPLWHDAVSARLLRARPDPAG